MEPKKSGKGSIEILIAEDSLTQAEKLRYLLEEHGYTVTTASDGKRALAAARQRKPALIISDVVMPEVDGFMLCGEIKRDERLQEVPVILLTTLSDVRDIMKGLECGADNFIRKPYEDDYLLARVEYLLMTNELRKSQKMRMGVEIYLGGQKHFITAERQQIVDLLISVYEEAVHLSEELKNRQRELADSYSTLTGLYNVAEGLNHAMSERDVCERALEHAMNLPEMQAGWIFLDDGSGTLRVGAARNLPPTLSEGGALDGTCECRRQFLAGELGRKAGIVECKRLRFTQGERSQLRHHVSVPLWSGNKSLGIMNLVGAGRELFKGSELETLYGIGHQVGIALERAHLHGHLEQLVEERTAALTVEIAERKRVENRFHTLFEFAPDAVVMIDPQGVIVLVNRQTEAVFGYQRAELLGKAVEKLLPEALSHVRANLRQVDSARGLSQAAAAASQNLLGRRKDGTMFPVDISLSPMEADGGVIVAAAVRDVTLRKVHEARIARLNRIYAVLSGINTTIVRVRERQQLFDEACRIAVELGKFALAWIGTVDADTLKIVPVASAGCDDGFLARVDLGTAENLPGSCALTAAALSRKQPVICNDIAADEAMQSLREEALRRNYRSAALFPLTLQGRLAGVLGLYSSDPGVFDADEKRLLVEMAGDISFALDHLDSEERFNYLAYYNAVTNLPNRALFIDRLDQKINAARHDHKTFSVIMLDINRFSSINETLGRQAGDDLLRKITAQLQEVLGEADILAHFSADLFALATHYDDEHGDIAHMLDKMLSTIQDRPFQAGGQKLRVSIKAGISSFPVDGEEAETLLHNAESALKNTRLSGDRYLFYTSSFNAMVAEKLSLENKLRQALEQDQLLLHYQPKVDIGSGRISGLEALMRWNDPETGIVLPPKFIPLLEETGMILEAGTWALEKAIADSLAWQTKKLRPPRIAVNVSPIQLNQKNFVSTIERVVMGSGDKAAMLELEITESLVMQDVVSNIQKLRMIRDMGVEVAIDDFGTGYSSLSYIAKLPANTLKIDQSFIANMTNNSDDLGIVSTIISLAHSLNMRVVAEGVESEEQARFLRLLKCDEIQGFLFSPAVPGAQIEIFLQENRSLPPIR